MFSAEISWEARYSTCWLRIFHSNSPPALSPAPGGILVGRVNLLVTWERRRVDQWWARGWWCNSYLITPRMMLLSAGSTSIPTSKRELPENWRMSGNWKYRKIPSFSSDNRGFHQLIVTRFWFKNIPFLFFYKIIIDRQWVKFAIRCQHQLL